MGCVKREVANWASGELTSSDILTRRVGIKIGRNGKVHDTARTSAPVDVFCCTYRNVSIVFNVPYVASVYK